MLVAAVDSERDAAARGLPELRREQRGPYEVLTNGRVGLLCSGVGAAAAAAATAAVLAQERHELVVNLGVGGGFAGRAEPGAVVVATDIIAADLGAETEDGFRTVAELSLGEVELPAAPLSIPGAATGPILTVNTVTGTDERAAELARRFEPAAEAMEGFGVALAAARWGVPAGEVRTICNVVGRRDRSRWQLPAALDRLAEVAAELATLVE